MRNANADNESSAHGTTRRVLLQGFAERVAVLGALPLISHAADANDATKLRPQVGDVLVFADGARARTAITPNDLAAGAPPISAWPMDRSNKIVRDGSRLNLVRIVRIDAHLLSAKAVESAADGILAFAAMCSHAGCDVLGWNAEAHHLVCPCHGSQFDALDAAAVVQGPATKPLALLPLKVEGGELLVARGFTRQVGFKPL